MSEDVLSGTVAFSALGIVPIEGKAVVEASGFIFAEGSFPDGLELVDFSFVDLEVGFQAYAGIVRLGRIADVLVPPFQVIKLSS